MFIYTIQPVVKPVVKPHVNDRVLGNTFLDSTRPATFFMAQGNFVKISLNGVFHYACNRD